MRYEITSHNGAACKPTRALPQVRRVLKFLESEQVLMAEHVRQTKRKLATDALNIATGGWL